MYFTINNINDYNISLKVDLLLLRCDIDFEIIETGFGFFPGSTNERIDLGNISLTKNDALVSSEPISVLPNESLKFSLSYSINRALYVENAKVELHRPKDLPVQIRTQKFKYRIKIVYTNPQTNEEGFDIKTFEQDQVIYLRE